ncbi:MAG: helix-turn-helix domain-containing protein [Patescibacteria group bacterium]|nr:helix-turn-helix domain-containing protein [Patescibacteria group bacterium]MDE2438019.1 helix-turn-helix domain-containing protein [Patescibacteria group bacterium]
MEEDTTLGTMIKRARLIQKKSLERVARDSGVPLERLVSLENDRILPTIPRTYAVAYLRKIAQCLDISEELILAQYNKEVKEDGGGVLFPSASRSLSMRIPFSRDVGLGILVACIVFGFLGYQAYNYFRYPFLSISFPEDSYLSSSSQIVVVGKTEAGVLVAINGVHVNVVGTSFSYPYTLAPGVNVLTITAQKRFGKQLHLERLVMYNP